MESSLPPPRRFTVIFLRHGQTDHNERKILQGHHDAPLNEKGRSQAALAGKALSNRTFHRIISSDLQRAFETAEIVKGKGPSSWPTIEKLEGCRERMFGAAEDRPLAEFLNLSSKAGLKPEEYTPEGAESPEVFLERIRKCLIEAVIRRHSDDEVILFVSHGGVIRGLIKYLMSLNVPKSGQSLRMGTSPNTGITEITFEATGNDIASIHALSIYDKSHLSAKDGAQEDVFKDNELR
eukprot:TRINITY_DN166_c1_g1_i7.p1 TRINITY_DN166_c1_g1~~TRINITY_DN166_c1_g1_i7.p1  ORF type:complete len:237 (+),score=63.03 TRINITY_DN166_c1_g1_i7:161-871(+)